MTQTHFVPHHINATTDDLAGNDGMGRYVLVPGSDGRAKEISHYFDNATIKLHPRGHHLYLGSIDAGGKAIDVAAISSGMGCASMEIILHELFHLGARRFLRVGTAGSLQPNFVKRNDIVNAQASVRDEHTTADYMPIAVPAVASIECTTAIINAAKKLGLAPQLHTGTVHCKSSLYAREFGEGPRGNENKAYLDLLRQCGILATEMETAALFIQTELYNYRMMQEGVGPKFRVLSGAILGIITVPPDQFLSGEEESTLIENLIELAFETIKTLSTG